MWSAALLLSFVRQRVDSVMATYAETVAADCARWEASPESALTDKQTLQVVAAFRTADVDASGNLSLVELRDWFVQYNAHIGSNELGAGAKSYKRVFDAFDDDHDQQ